MSGPTSLPGEEPVEAAEIPQIEYVDLVLRHLRAVLGSSVSVQMVQAQAFTATVELEDEVAPPPDSHLLVDEAGRALRLPRTAAVLEALLETSAEPLPDLLPLVGGSMGTVVVTDARRLSGPLSPSRARRALRGHAVAPWRNQILSVSATEDLEGQWSIESLEEWLAGDRTELWEEAATNVEPVGVLLFAPLVDQLEAGCSDPVGELPDVVEGLGRVSIVRCRLNASSPQERRGRGIRVADPISVDTKSWVFVA